MSISNLFINKNTLKEHEVQNSDLFNGFYIPQDFRKKILRHLILNYSSNINGVQPSLFLAVQGCRGEGKTFMIQTICEYYNIDIKYISGSDLCGPNEGDSKNKIKKEYEASCINFSKTKKLAVIVIDDFHLSIASNLGENVSKTTNSQVLVSYLMNLADHPYQFNVRVPIILLGNNFQNIYSALIRNGRTDFYSWTPSIDEKINIVYYMYKKFYPNIRLEDIKQLVDLYPNKYIAFFKDVIQDLFFSGFDLIVNEFEKQHGNFRLDEIDGLVENFLHVNRSTSLERLKNFAAKRDSTKGENFE